MNLTPSTIDCAARQAAVAAGTLPLAQLKPGPGQRQPPCGLAMGPGNIGGRTIAIAQLANVLSMRLTRVVVDRTQLQGRWDLFVTFNADQLPPIPPGSLPPNSPPNDPNAPPLLTALEEQLGLKLESVKGPPVEVLVIDHVERPTEN